MINSKEIRDKAQKQYIKLLKSLLTGEDIFPLTIPGNRGANLPYLQRIEGMKELRKNSKAVLGYGYTLETREKQSRMEGVQTVISRIIFSNREDLLKFLGREQEYTHFLATVEKLKPYSIDDFIINRPKTILDNMEIMDDVIKVLDYFINNPVSSYFIRELPIDVDTKFIENNRTIISNLLEFLLPQNRININEKIFEKRYGLKYDDNFYIHIRSLDKKLQIGGFSELAIPINEIMNLQIKPKQIYIVENRTNYLIFPERENALVIWGRGRAVTLLKDIPQLKSAELFYWGDVDPTGFEILNSLREYYPHTISIHMSGDILNICSKFITRITGFKKCELNNLNKDEEELYSSLFFPDYQLRLEQENIRL